MTILTPHQEEAVRTVVARIKGVITPEPLTYIGGFAGTGKSTILPHILEAVGFQPEHVTFCAPTGKAAKVMRTKLKTQGYPNFNSSTIHSAIYRAKPAPVATLEEALAHHESQLADLIKQIQQAHEESDVPDKRPLNLNEYPEVGQKRKFVSSLRAELESVYDDENLSFQLNPDSIIQNSQLIVVDEASMVGKRMAHDLMSFGVPILAIGDPGQLPPVEDDAGLTAGAPDFFLREIHRQAEGNPIIHLSKLAREGEDLPYGDYGNGVQVMKRSDYDYTGSFADRPQFIVGMNKTRWRVTQMLRKDFGYIEKVQHMLGPRAGEPLIVKKNTREYPNLVNGTECVALGDIDLIPGQARVMCSFEDDDSLKYKDKQIFQGKFEEHFSKKAGSFTAPKSVTYRAMRSSIVMDWNYVSTAHTAQGSQWDDVVVIDESSVFREDANRWLYTSVTRAAEKLIVLR